MIELKDKIALITGAGKGIGRATSLALAKEGVHLVLTSRNQAEIDELAKEVRSLGVRAIAFAGDATQEGDVLKVKEAALLEFGKVDILINNVGVGKYGPVSGVSADEYDWIMDTNMRSSFLFTRHFLPEMLTREDGWIVFLSSVAGLRGLSNEAVYCASKCAQMGFAQALDYEVRQHNIKVSVIAPGATKTHFAIGTGRVENDPKLDTYSDPEDVAEAVLFALKQPPKTRVFLIGMRPMVEAL